MTAELLRMADMMESYVKGCAHASVANLSGSPDARLANLIDNFKQPGEVSLEISMSGHRKYMCSNKTVDAEWIADEQTKKGKGTEKQQLQLQSKGMASQSHIVETTHFIKMLRKRLQIPLSEHNKPLQFPLCEVGYSVRCVERLKQHASHNSSNYVMKLADAVLNVRRDNFNSRYTIAYYPAGMSNHSTSTISAREWDAAKEYMVTRSPWVHNLQYRIFKLREEIVQAKKNNEDRVEEARGKALETQVEAQRRELEKQENEVQILARLVKRKAQTNAASLQDYVDMITKIADMMERYEPLRQYMTDMIKSLERQSDIAEEISNSVADLSTLQLNDDAGEEENSDIH